MPKYILAFQKQIFNLSICRFMLQYKNVIVLAELTDLWPGKNLAMPLYGLILNIKQLIHKTAIPSHKQIMGHYDS